jgi:6-phosphogluconolactonase
VRRHSVLFALAAGFVAIGCLPPMTPNTPNGGSAGSGGSGPADGNGGSAGNGGSQGGGGTQGGGGAQGGGGTGGSGGGNPTSPPDMAVSGVPFVYISGYAGQIGVYQLNPQTGALTSKSTTPYGSQPSFLAVEPKHQYLYAIDEMTSKVAAFAINQTTGALTHIGTDPGSGGTGPAFVGIDRSGKYVLVANYGSGAVATYPIGADGTLAAIAGSGAPGTNAHMMITDPGNKYAFVPCLGSNYLAEYTFDATTGKLGTKPLATVDPSVPAAVGQGPRHIAFNPTGTLLYLMNETASSVTRYTYDAASGKLTGQETLSALKTPVAGNTGAEIVVSSNGKFVYTSNRGDNSIAVFSADSAGKLTLVTQVKTGGTVPRNFTIDPTGQWLIVANEGLNNTGNNVGVFKIDGVTGIPSAVGAPIAVSQPSFIGVVMLPGA